MKLFAVLKEAITIFPTMMHVVMNSQTYTVIIPLA